MPPQDDPITADKIAEALTGGERIGGWLSMGADGPVIEGTFVPADAESDTAGAVAWHAVVVLGPVPKVGS
jgi:hypothetical protein